MGEGDILVDIDEVTRAVYILSHLKRLSDMVDQADSIYASLPKTVRESLSQEACVEQTFGPQSSSKVAMNVAKLSPTVRDDLKMMLDEITLYVDRWMNPDSGTCGMLDETELGVIREMITFIQTVGPRSTRSLLHALQQANSGDWSYILIRAKGRDSEIGTRRKVSDTTSAEFGME